MSLIKHAFLFLGVFAFATTGCAASEEGEGEDEVVDETAASELNASDSVEIDWQSAVKTIAKKAPSLDVYTPARIPKGIFDGKNGKVYVSADVFDDHGKQYSINFDYTKDCHGSNACTAGSIWSSPRSGFKPNGKINGVPIRFEDISCGASCSPATISWLEKDRQITIGLKASRKDIEAAVKSALHGGAR